MGILRCIKLVTSAANIKTKIYNKLFAGSQEYNRTVTIQKKSTTNGFYGVEETITSSDEHYVVTLDYKKYALKYDKAGKYSNATFILLCNPDIELDYDDIVLIDSDEYKIVNIEEPIMSSTTLLTKAFIEKKGE